MIEEFDVEEPVRVDLEAAKAKNKSKKKAWPLFLRQLPARESLDDAEVIPLATASLFAKLTFSWVSTLMATGFNRPLEATDLWKMDPSRESLGLSDRFLTNLAKRQASAANYNSKLPFAKAGAFRQLKWNIQATRDLPAKYAAFGPTATHAERRSTLEVEWRAESGVRHGSVALALSDTFPGFWLAGPWKIVSDACNVVYPLVLKEIIIYTQHIAAAQAASEPIPSIGIGIAWAFGLFVLLNITYVCRRQFFFRAVHEGTLMRAALVAAIYKRAFKLSIGGRMKHSDGKLMTMLSADISRIESATEYFHCAWVAPIIVVATITLICVQVGASGLLGVVVFLVAAPLQTWLLKVGLTLRKKAMQWTEKRTKLLQSLLSSMSIVKMFTYEPPFLEQLRTIRHKEMDSMRVLMYIRAVGDAMTLSLPSTASIFVFVLYAHTSNTFNPAIIFTTLVYFNTLRSPLNQMPQSLSKSADAYSAVKRLGEFFEAETVGERIAISPKLEEAVKVDNATFQWPASLVDGEDDKVASEPFAIPHLNMTIPRGHLVAVVGPVGCGKSSLLQGLIGDMTLASGTVEFGGRLAYCSQAAWIQCASVRENIVFGQPWDEEHYWRCVRDASLLPDLEMMPAGDETEIGEKGINISGGQKQRINIARALYFNADIVLLDDPLSAVDAHVGRALFNDAILGLRRAGKTVILATHALHLLPKVDYVYTMFNGKIIEHGTYSRLMAAGGAFKLLMEDFGGARERRPKKEEDIASRGKPTQDMPEPADRQPARTGIEGALMTKEDRKVGAVGKEVYMAYFKSGGLKYLLIAIIMVTIMQGASSMSTVWLTYWSENKFTQAGSFYQGMYGLLGIITATFTLFSSMAMAKLSVHASCNLYDNAVYHIFHSPMRFFDTTPLGRILNVFGKDIDGIDNVVSELLEIMVIVIASLIGAVVVISINFPYFVAIVFGVGVVYMSYAWYYRRTAREVKRIDSVLRGLHYAHFAESLSGMSTIRAYGETERFIKENAYRIDLQNRAYLITKANQEWLESRLNFVGNVLVLVIALMCAVTGGRTVAPAAVGMCLVYLGTTTGMLSAVAELSIQIETSMNSVERVLYYSDGTLPQEAAYQVPSTFPKGQWPSSGAIQVEHAVMSYRPGLPPVLKDVSFKVGAGERIGIVGRTGAGKTSITVALYRLVELTSGKITIDGVDISSLGLKTLRESIGIIPQDPILFNGTLRSNLDPFNNRTDAALYDALKRACLGERFALNMAIEDGGSNLSIGERSLVSLARAFVEDAKIMVLDEATAAVDLETDGKIQAVIRDECKRSGKTLLCIAHRLRTIIGWDKILVMDAGEVAEFASPLKLWDDGGIFRSMCERSSITREEIALSSNAWCTV